MSIPEVRNPSRIRPLGKIPQGMPAGAGPFQKRDNYVGTIPFLARGGANAALTGRRALWYEFCFHQGVEPETGGVVAGERMDKSKRKILIIEDDPDVSRVLATLLAKLDAEVVTAPDGLAGVALALSERPQLILMDIQLPRMNGLDAIRTLRGYEELADVPVIVLTGFANPENIRQAVEVGADDFLVKANVVVGEGLERIRQALDARPTKRRPLLRSGSPFGRPSSAP